MEPDENYRQNLKTSSFIDSKFPGARLLAYVKFLAFLLFNPGVFGREPARQVFLRQVYFTTLEQLRRITAVSALTGMVIITQISQAFGYDEALIGKALVWAVIRELGPLITAILVISSSGAAITAELASMKINKEFDALRVMGIDPMDYLVAPRMAGAVASVFLLNAYFQAGALLGGGALSLLIIDVSFQQYIMSILHSVNVSDMGLSMAKSLAFGSAIASVGCSHGVMVGDSITNIPKAIIGAQMRGLFMVFAIDGIMAYLAIL